jgi:predicted dehydrogenase
MKIMLLGGKGNMGQRYAAILRRLSVRTVICDVGDDPLLHKDVSGVIVVTPTRQHHESILEVAPLKVPILCEKPVTLEPSTLPELRDKLIRLGVPSFSMVHQYRHFETSGNGHSIYDYFKHGNDGLIWDCFQIIALAKGSILVGEESPVWYCQVNGKQLDLREMDYAYVTEISAWINHIKNGTQPEIGWDYIIDSHQKVDMFYQEWAERTGRHANA